MIVFYVGVTSGPYFECVWSRRLELSFSFRKTLQRELFKEIAFLWISESMFEVVLVFCSSGLGNSLKNVKFLVMSGILSRAGKGSNHRFGPM